MQKLSTNFAIFFITLTLALMTISSATYAKRFGGGKSFGKKSYSTPFKRNTNNQKSQHQLNNAKQNQTRKEQLTKRGGLMGILGGLALGGLLGALFFGGAFEGINFMDILLFGGIAFLLYKLFASRRVQSNQTAGASSGPDMQAGHAENQYQRQAHQQQEYSSAPPPPPPESSANLSFPSWFNKDDFLLGAKKAFTDLQNAWDKGNMDFIQSMSSAEVFAEIHRQFQQQNERGTTKVISLEAEIIDYSDSPMPEVTVVFEAQITESDVPGAMGQTHVVQEQWIFLQTVVQGGSKQWLLDGIQQLDS